MSSGVTEKDPWRGCRVNSILHLNDSMLGFDNKKANKSQNLLGKAICIKAKYWTILVQDFQISSPSVSWKINISLTQKYTMDRGTWIKNFRKKACRGTQKRTKFQKHQKCKMAWEWGTNEYICLPYVTILWCLSGKLPKGIRKLKLIYLT